MSDDQDPVGLDLQRLVRVDWSATRAHRTELGLGVRRRRKVTRNAVLAAAAVGAFALAVWPSQDEPIASPPEPIAAIAATRPPDAATPSPVLVAPSPPPAAIRQLRFSAGATATPMADDAALRVVGESPEQIVVALDAGAARFDITPTPGQPFRMVAPRPRHDDIAIDVVGARAQFAVVREAHRVHIEVYDGLLSVTSRDGVRELGSGATYDVPTRSTADVVAKKRDLVVPQKDPPPVAVQPAPPIDMLDELLLAADSARQGGHHEEAVELLRRGLRDHAGDARAPLAAFTLGRVLLQLKRPAEAVEAFATADRLAPNGPMAQDAVARQIEAMAAAGKPAEARALAEAYVTRFPDGRRLADVRVWGGL